MTAPVTPDVPEQKVDSVPLFVDLDGTLIKSDLLVESALALFQRAPWHLLAIVFWLFTGGKARVKAEIAWRVKLDVNTLPLQGEFVEFLRDEASRGRRIYLATASDRRFASQLADRLGLFAGVLASDGHHNLKGTRKLDAILELTSGGAFDYAGNARADLPVWKHARRALVVNPDPAVRNAARDRCEVERIFEDRLPAWRTWPRAVRLYQWFKNLLLVVPLLTSHSFDSHSFSSVLLGFIAFGCVASATYLLNDLLDLASDRRHPRKCKRPFAAGDIPLISGILVMPLFLGVGLELAFLLSPHFLLITLTYLILTLSYSLRFKTYMLIDVILLAGLYTVRVIAGGIAINVELSSWLLAFSMFTFLNLALVKRSSELLAMDELGRAGTSGRDYRVSDYESLKSMGIAAGYLSVLVLALFIDNQNIHNQYSHPAILWLLCPLVLYWVSRLWMKTARGEMHDDPLVFCLRDRSSWIIFLALTMTMLAAI